MKILITLVFMMGSLFATAQEKTDATESKKITGVISDTEGMPIPGANVTIESTEEKVQTDFDGNYTINAKEGDKLVASYIGMFDETILINQQNSIDLKLKEDSTVIVWNGNCYGPYTKTKLTSEPHAIKSITALWEEIKEFTEMLKNGNTSPPLPETKPLVIRCIGSVNGDPEPLYVIDNVPLNADNFKAINPDDIISINVLKDGGATSIYGNRGIDGVIIVKTKNGLTKKEKHKLKRESKKLEKEQKTVTN